PAVSTIPAASIACTFIAAPFSLPEPSLHEFYFVPPADFADLVHVRPSCDHGALKLFEHAIHSSRLADHQHAPRRVSRILVAMRNLARREHEAAGRGTMHVAAGMQGEFAFEYVEILVLAMMYVHRGPAARRRLNLYGAVTPANVR